MLPAKQVTIPIASLWCLTRRHVYGYNTQVNISDKADMQKLTREQKLNYKFISA